jgi:hypothetical protein
MSARRKLRDPSKPLPPFGKAVADAVRQGKPINTYIMAGPDSWNRHKKRVDRVVLPPDISPSAFDWSIFKGQSPLVIADDADPDRIRELLRLLVKAPVKLVGCVFLEDGVTHCRFFRP